MFEQKVRVFKTRETAKLPERAHLSDAGMDFFFAPEFNEPVSIDPGGSAILPTGIKMQVPPGHMLQIMNKSGIAAKRSLITGACVVVCIPIPARPSRIGSPPAPAAPRGPGRAPGAIQDYRIG